MSVLDLTLEVLIESNTLLEDGHRANVWWKAAVSILYPCTDVVSDLDCAQ